MYGQRLFLFCLMLVIVCESIFAQRRPDFSASGNNMPSQNMSTTDTIAKPPLVFKTYQIGRLSYRYGDLDTTLTEVHLTDPYYRQKELGGHLGSEYAASYGFVFRQQYEGLVLGQNTHPSMLGYDGNDVVVTNRSYWDMQYGRGNIFTPRGFLATRADFKMRFFKPFARNIALNFTYASNTDDGWLTNQSVNFKRLNLKLFQRTADGQRVSYIVYDNPRVLEEFARINADDNGSLVEQRRRIEIGNILILKDSVAVGHKIPSWHSKLVFSNDQYEVLSGELGAIDTEVYPQVLSGQGLRTVDYLNQAKSIKWSNSYHNSGLGGVYSVGVDIERWSWSGGSDGAETLYPLTLRGTFDKDIGTNSKVGLSSRLGMGATSGDYGLKAVFQSHKKDVLWSLSALVESMVPSLAQRGLTINDTVAIIGDPNFSNIDHRMLEIKWDKKLKNWSLSLRVDQYEDLILPSKEGDFGQRSFQTFIWYGALAKTFRFGAWNSKHRVSFQSTNNSDILRASWQYYGNISIDIPIFKQKMLTRLGLDLFVIPSYQIPVFRPLLGDFGISDVRAQSGDIVLANPYLNVQVDQFYFFVKATNLAQPILPRAQSFTQGYPVYDTRIVFGVRWILLD